MNDQKTPPPMAPALTAEQFAQLLEAVRSGTGASNEIGSALLKLAEAQQSTAAQTARTARHSNAYSPGINAFSHPEGEEAHPKEKLKYETFFCGVRQDNEQATPSEIALFNQITTSKRARGGTWTADVDLTKNRLVIMVPHASVDERMMLPVSLKLILREFIDGTDAVDPTKLMDEVARLRAMVESLKPGTPTHAAA